MICQNCGALVDDDLIFCTNCGERLVVPTAHTVPLNDSVVTQAADAKPPKSSSPLKWIALILALIAIPASIFGVYLLMNSQKNLQVSQNINKSNSPVQTPTRKSEINQNSNANTSSEITSLEDTNLDNANSDQSFSTPKTKIEVINERIEIAPKSHYAKPFEITTDTAKFVGNVELLQGETYKGYVYLQSEYDNHFPDETYKMFIFGEEKKSQIKATLVQQNYVLIFLNESDKPIVIQADLSLE